MRLCKDCKHCIPIRYFGIFTSWDDIAVGSWLKCAKTKRIIISPVDGHKSQSGPYSCFSTRSFSSTCGPDAIGWEAKHC